MGDFSSGDRHGIGPCLRGAGLCFPAAQVEALNLYLDILIRWQSSINLVSPASLPDAVRRHVLDSAQLLARIPASAQRLVDLGSGAGFPGLVVAILRPDLSVTLVESDQKKCRFLETVSRETGAGARVLSARIEAVASDEGGGADVLTARALASLSRLLGYASPWFEANPALVALFLKGRDFAEELRQAEALGWAFSCEASPSVTDEAARILRLSGLRKDSGSFATSRCKNPGK